MLLPLKNVLPKTYSQSSSCHKRETYVTPFTTIDPYIDSIDCASILSDLRIHICNQTNLLYIFPSFLNTKQVETICTINLKPRIIPIVTMTRNDFDKIVSKPTFT